MNWSSWSAFWDMGGYWLYVWGSFGVTAAALLAELLLLKARRGALREAADAQGDLPNEA
mgnify:CR=1 FL=1